MPNMNADGFHPFGLFKKKELPKYCLDHGCLLEEREYVWETHYNTQTGQGFQSRQKALYCAARKRDWPLHTEPVEFIGKEYSVPVPKGDCKDV